jgi:hypothetical protein
MGMDYHLETEDGSKSKNIELAVAGYVALKDPSEATEDLVLWIEFIQKHSGKIIKLVDCRGNETDPAHVSGGYVIGVQDYNPKWEPRE